MFHGRGIWVLVIGLVSVSVLVIILEWRAVWFLSKASGTEASEWLTPVLPKGFQNLRRSRAGGVEPSGLPSFPTPPEVRHPSCMRKHFDLAKLPRTTVVIPYLNETWAQVSATVAAILAHTPSDLLDEVLFIDDGNEQPWQYHAELTAMHPKIRIHRNEERQGLIRAKVVGAASVRSEVIVFFEPHCIVLKDWLQPLLEQLLTTPNHDMVVMPMIDIIPEKDFSDYKVAQHHIGGFDWTLTFNWMELIEKRNASYVYPDPYPTPALSGGIFGIWRDYWERMGTYDTNMSEWGGEHIEMSLRTWRCGGRIEVVPCSRLGHVFRSRNPYLVHQMAVLRNQKRVALVWLDEHLETFFQQVPLARFLDAGEVGERRRLKESLHCKSMDWYIENVYPEMMTKQPRRR